jgi:UDP-glucuronate decarboxylase
LEGRHVFIVGGAGFIGTRIVSELALRNHVTIFDSLHRNALEASGLAAHPNVHLIEGDILEEQQLLDSLSDDVDVVLHLAAIAGVDTVLKDPVRTLEVNVTGTFNVLRALRRRDLTGRLERFVNFSTSEVLGTSAFQMDELANTNLAPVGEARWTYAVGKLTGEHLVMAYHRTVGLRAVSIRPFNVYGPGQVGEGAIHQFVLRAIAGEDLVIHGDGDQIRAWCYIDDMVRGVLLCLEQEQAVGEIFNIGNPRATVTVLELAKKVRQAADSSSAIVHVAKPYVDVDLRVPRVEKARTLLGFEAEVELEEGLARTIDWYRIQDEEAT